MSLRGSSVAPRTAVQDRPSIAGRSVTRLTRSGEAAHRCSRAQHHRLSPDLFSLVPTSIAATWQAVLGPPPRTRPSSPHPRASRRTSPDTSELRGPLKSPRRHSQPTAPGWLALSAACGSSLSRHIRTVGTPSYWVGHRFECDWLLSGVLPCQRPVASVIWVALLYKGVSTSPGTPATAHGSAAQTRPPATPPAPAHT